MITEIGIAAGDIWNYLDQNGSATLDQLQNELKHSRETLLMGLGWLAREGHITLGSQESGFVSELKQSKS